MKRLSSKLIPIILALLIALSWVFVAMAAPVYLGDDRSVLLEEADRSDGRGNLTAQGHIIEDRDGTGKYFYHVEQMLPGDHFTKDYKLDNQDRNHDYDLWFRTQDAINWFRSMDGERVFTDDPALNGVSLDDLKVGGSLYGLRVSGLKQTGGPSAFSRGGGAFTMDDLKAELNKPSLYGYTLEDLKAGGRLYGLKVPGLSESGSTPAAFTRGGGAFSAEDLKEELRLLRLLDKITLKIYLNDSDVPFYTGPMSGRGTPNTTDIIPFIPPAPQNVPANGNPTGETAIKLCTLPKGQTYTLRTEVILDGATTGNEYQGMGGQITWVFIARRIEESEKTSSTPRPPTTTPPRSPTPPVTTPGTPTGETPETPTDPTVPTGPGDPGTPAPVTPTTPGRPTSPITGDDARLMFYLIASLVSAVALIVILTAMKRKKDAVGKRK